MGVIRFDPMRGFEAISKKVNDMMTDFDKGLNIEFGGFSPRIDITEDEKNLFFHVELPGVKKEDVKVTINEDKLLIIKGEKKRDSKFTDTNDDITFLRAERNYGAFSRSFELPDNVNTDSISAKYDNGTLEVSLDKIEPQKPKEVEVSIN